MTDQNPTPSQDELNRLADLAREAFDLVDEYVDGISDGEIDSRVEAVLAELDDSTDDPLVSRASEADIHRRINVALDGRRSQRAFVDQLAESWAEMSNGLDRLVDLLNTVEASGRRQLATTYSADLAAAIDDLSSDGTAFGRSRSTAIRDRRNEAGRQIDAASARVRRDTVNIGVVGRARAGKSTLLRTITNLPDSVVPSTRFQPTTAVASSIYHTDGSASATLLLHTWESFRDLYLAPLHELAGLGPVPDDIDGFRRFHYAAESGNPRPDGYLRWLQIAQRSLASYEDLLLGIARTRTVDFADLQRYVAHPHEDEGSAAQDRPYHAVRSVRIERPFLDGIAARLGLIDLPGVGEVGLDIDRQFIRQVKNEIDLLLMVKRLDRTSAAFLAEDVYTRNLADSARGGVPLDDFFSIVVNLDRAHDPGGVVFDHAVKQVWEVSAEQNIRVLTVDVTDRGEVVAGLLEPVLQHLGIRLAEMDRAVVREALTLAAAVADDVAVFAGVALRRAHAVTRLLPDQEDEFRTVAKRLRDELAVDLYDLVDRYDANSAAGDGDPTLAAAVSAAVDEARTWVRSGLGFGDRATWINGQHHAYLHGPLELKQNEYHRARTEITRIFSRIDLALNESVQRLWDEVAEVLRHRLTMNLVPVGPDALDHLRATAEARRATILTGALRDLCELKQGCGSFMLRVAWPIIRGIRWGHAASAPQQATHGVEALYDEVTAATEACIAELETALRTEARMMTRMLTAAIDRFYDSAVHGHRSEREYECLCRPNMRHIWPGLFDEGISRLAADLGVVEEQARSTAELASRVSRLSAGLYLSPVEPVKTAAPVPNNVGAEQVDQRGPDYRGVMSGIPKVV